MGAFEHAASALFGATPTTTAGATARGQHGNSCGSSCLFPTAAAGSGFEAFSQELRAAGADERPNYSGRATTRIPTFFAEEDDEGKGKTYTLDKGTNFRRCKPAHRCATRVKKGNWGFNHTTNNSEYYEVNKKPKFTLEFWAPGTKDEGKSGVTSSDG